MKRTLKKDQKIKNAFMFKTTTNDIYRATYFIYLPEPPK